jgi:CIC family chloride channel protein
MRQSEDRRDSKAPRGKPRGILPKASDTKVVSPGMHRFNIGVHLDQWFSRLLGGQSVFLILLAALVGVAGGYGAILFRFSIDLVNRAAFPGGIGLEQIASTSWYWVVLVPALGGLIVGPLVYFLAREAKGHGVPEVMDACKNLGGRIRPRVAVVKILSSAICIGSGGSVGREGPIVQIGSAVGSSMGQLFGIYGERLKTLVACGAAAGIAATFNAPIAGVLFSIEIILGRGSARTFSPLVVAAVIATVVTRYHLGNSPAFIVPAYDMVSVWEIPLYVLLGALAAAVGVAFTRGLYALEDLWDLLPGPAYAKPVFGGAIIGIIALWLPQVMGVGYEHIENVLDWESGNMPPGTLGALGILLLLMAAKIFATGNTIGSGGSGGIFAPSLFIGACLGGAFGALANAVLPAGIVASPSAYALVCMGALVGATTHAPLTAILIVFELTDQHSIILPLMLSCVIATFVSTRLCKESIYTLKLSRRGAGTFVGTEADIMSGIQVGCLIHPIEHSLFLDTPLEHSLDQVLSSGNHRQYVIDKEGRPQGVVTMEEVSTIIREESSMRNLLVAADLMRPLVGIVSPGDTLDRCIALFSQHHIEELPVVDRAGGHLVGWIRQDDVISLYNREVLHRESVLKFTEDRGSAGPSSEELVHLSTGDIKDEIAVDGLLVGKSLRALDLRTRYGVIVCAVRHRRGDSTFPDPSVELAKGDTLVVVGPEDKVGSLQKAAKRKLSDRTSRNKRED